MMAATVGGGWVIGIQPQLSAAASTNDNRARVIIQNQANQALLARLKRDYEGIDELKKKLEFLRAAVPPAADISTFVSELNSLASSHKITVKAFSVTDAKPYTPPATDPGRGLKMTNPKITPANFVVIPIQFSISGDYLTVLDYVHDVQNGPRLFLVSTLSTTGSTSAAGVVKPKEPTAPVSQQVDATVGGFIYVLLDLKK